jgi:serine/threonine protein kinase
MGSSWDAPGLDAVLLSYMEQMDRGEAVDREALQREHPEHAAALRSYFGLVDALAATDRPAAPARPAAGLVGQVLLQTYQVERLIGQGAMGQVYQARNLRTGNLFAIKVLDREAAHSPDAYARFQAEARAVSALRHPAIVRVMDFAHLPDGSPLMVLEHLAGEDLRQRLRRVGRLALPEALRITRQVARCRRRTGPASSIATSSRPTSSWRGTRRARR